MGINQLKLNLKQSQRIHIQNYYLVFYFLHSLYILNNYTHNILLSNVNKDLYKDDYSNQKDINKQVNFLLYLYIKYIKQDQYMYKQHNRGDIAYIFQHSKVQIEIHINTLHLSILNILYLNHLNNKDINNQYNLQKLNIKHKFNININLELYSYINKKYYFYNFIYF